MCGKFCDTLQVLPEAVPILPIVEPQHVQRKGRVRVESQLILNTCKEPLRGSFGFAYFIGEFFVSIPYTIP